MFKLEFDREHVWQWDLNQRLILTDVDLGIEVHFSHPFVDTKGALPVFTYEENGTIYANIPNELLQVSGYFIAYVYTCMDSNRNENHTKTSISVEIKEREKPADYEYTPTEVLNYRKLISDTLAGMKEAYMTERQSYGPFSTEQNTTTGIELEFNLNGEPVDIEFVPVEVTLCSIYLVEVSIEGSKATVYIGVVGTCDTDEAHISGVCIYRLNKYDEEVIAELIDKINGEVI